VASLDILNNVIPYIAGEEEKVELEPRKILGALHQDRINLASLTISAQTNRVAVSDGHTVCLSVELETPHGISARLPGLWQVTLPHRSAATCPRRLTL